MSDYSYASYYAVRSMVLFIYQLLTEVETKSGGYLRSGETSRYPTQNSYFIFDKSVQKLHAKSRTMLNSSCKFVVKTLEHAR